MRDKRPKGAYFSNSLWGAERETPFPPPQKLSQSSIPEVFFENAAFNPRKLFSRTRKLPDSYWHSVSWGEAAQHVGLLAQHLRQKYKVTKGTHIGILSQTRYEWVIADLAILTLGAVSVPLYHSLPEAEVGFLLWDASIDIVFAENEEQVRKLEQIDSEVLRIPSVGESAGEAGTSQEIELHIKQIITFEDVSISSFENRKNHFQEIITSPLSQGNLETWIQEQIKNIERRDIASIVYTSGTTGAPKGVVQTHGNHLAMLDGVLLSRLLGTGEGLFLFLPLAHSFARLIAYCVIAAPGDFIFPAIANPKKSLFNASEMFQDIKESHPKIFPSVPRIFEKLMTKLNGKSGGGIKDKLLSWSISFHQEFFKISQKTLWKKIQFLFAQFMVRRIREGVFGKKLLFAVSGGAPLDISVIEFFSSIGVRIYEGYGLTETTPAISANTEKYYKPGTVGRVFEGVEIKIAESDGEIFARGDNIAKGYYRRPKETEEVFFANGWFATGDIGEIDKDGFLKITDRKKELIVNAGGKNISPALVEGKAKASPYISQALVYGDRQPYLVALITLEEENISKWAAAHEIVETEANPLCQHPSVYKLIQNEIQLTGKNLAGFEQIKKFKILKEDFTVENGCLSPSMKLKRKKVTADYKDIIENLYTKG